MQVLSVFCLVFLLKYRMVISSVNVRKSTSEYAFIVHVCRHFGNLFWERHKHQRLLVSSLRGNTFAQVNDILKRKIGQKVSDLYSSDGATRCLLCAAFYTSWLSIRQVCRFKFTLHVVVLLKMARNDSEVKWWSIVKNGHRLLLTLSGQPKLLRSVG